MNSKRTRTSAPRQDRAIKRIRSIIFGTISVLGVALIAAGIFYVYGGGSDGFEPGEDYRVVEKAPPRNLGEPILVQEVFSYACVHCRNFDPLIEEWRETLPEDVVFERLPAMFSPGWHLLAQTYYTLQETGALERNHDRLFRAIHDTGRVFTSIEATADFVDGFGTTSEEFLAAARGPTVTARLADADRIQREINLTGVPTLVVDGRYVVGMAAGRKGALDIVDHLIASERALRAGEAAPADAEGAPAAETPPSKMPATETHVTDEPATTG